ncbi:MAG: thiamine pyrophosphate-dependent enzyme [Candidatus Hydrogenedentes bacterium]|nr:thiamine pyrophosphate-dependent enzyme [Candidatus Hydrogenedentota bacterium]
MNENATGGEIRVDEHPSDEMLRADRLPHILCPGCGIGSAMHSLTEAITETDRDKHVCVSGIGCSGRVAGYVDVDSYHTTHGRAIPFAVGVAVQNPELCVTVVSGDGDLAAIGGNHLIHAARKNVDMNIICINNFNYGMTGGQAGPTTPIQSKSTTTPLGVVDRPFNLPYLAHAVGAPFVSRWSTIHVRQLKQTMLRAMAKPGFCFIEVISPCPTNYGKSNGIGSGLQEMERYRTQCVVDHDANLADIDIDLSKDDSQIVVGDFVNVERPHFEPVMAHAAAPAV